MIHAAANEVQPAERQVKSNRTPWIIAGASAVLLLVITLGMTGFPALDLGTSQGEAAPETTQVSPPVTNQAASQLTVQSMNEPLPDANQPEAMGIADNGMQTGNTSEQFSPPVLTSQVEFPLQEDWFGQQHSLAWIGLAQLWHDNTQADAIRAACAGEPRTGFACIREQGNWSRIRRLGLPALLVLHTDEPRYLLLSGMSETQILAGVGEDSRWLARDVVEEFWLGGYVVVWPQAPGWPEQIRQGESGQAVDIVMEMAKQADVPWNGGPEFNAGFESWLMEFQRRHGLEADGIVGPVTLLHLMAPTIDSPRLVERHELTAQES
jgi:peptidoglycan hydrolase-like protein with peptidoglycan-binding domain